MKYRASQAIDEQIQAFAHVIEVNLWHQASHRDYVSVRSSGERVELSCERINHRAQ
jgi:hypothetical protein